MSKDNSATPDKENANLIAKFCIGTTVVGIMGLIILALIAKPPIPQTEVMHRKGCEVTKEYFYHQFPPKIVRTYNCNNSETIVIESQT